MQAEAERLGSQVRQAQAEAAAAQQRAADLEWRLQRQEQSLAERAHMASEAKQVTDVLLEVRHPPSSTVRLYSKVAPSGCSSINRIANPANRHNKQDSHFGTPS